MMVDKKTLMDNSTKRNLLAELEECVDTLPNDEMHEEPVQVNNDKKIKWGPQLACQIRRRSANDGRTMLQKATELKSIKIWIEREKHRYIFV